VVFVVDVDKIKEISEGVVGISSSLFDERSATVAAVVAGVIIDEKRLLGERVLLRGGDLNGFIGLLL
jgi:hypothetical protein